MQKPIPGGPAVIATTGFNSSLATAVFTLIALAVGICTPPLSGSFCPSGCFEYPYSEAIQRFPRDYLWMYPAMLFLVSYVVLFACIHCYTEQNKKIFSTIALIFSTTAFTLLAGNYFVQLSVIQPSLLKGETVGIALLTQFNDHGLFIALEEIGYIIMSFSFLFAGNALDGDRTIRKAIRWIFIAGFFLTIAAFVFISLKFGIMRGCIFEVAVISITWLVLIVASVLLAVLFRTAIHESLGKA